jgi:hypothetical protein
VSPTKKPSAVSGLRRGIGSVPAAAAQPGIAPAAQPKPAPAGGAVPPPRPEKPIRFTLDLDRGRHQYLKNFTFELSAVLGPGRAIGGAEVLRALIDELQSDAALAQRVQWRIWKGRTQ